MTDGKSAHVTDTANIGHTMLTPTCWLPEGNPQCAPTMIDVGKSCEGCAHRGPVTPTRADSDAKTSDWCAVIVRAGQEIACAEYLNSQGCTAYTPIAKRLIRRKLPKTGSDLIEIGALPCYLFASFEINHVNTDRAPGFYSLMKVSGEIAVVRQSDLDKVLKREAEGEFDCIPRGATAPVFTIGDKVIVSGGSLIGKPAVVVSQDGDVTLDVSFFGRTIRACIAPQQIEKVSSASK